MPGKVSPDDLLAHVFERTGAAETDETIVQGPADGEDAAAIDWPDGEGRSSSAPIRSLWPPPRWAPSASTSLPTMSRSREPTRAG